MHEGGGRWVGSNKLVELKKKKESTCNVGDPGSVPSPSLEKGMATQSSILAWRMPWMEEPGGLQSVGLDMIEPLILLYFLARVLFFFLLFTMEYFKQTY